MISSEPGAFEKLAGVAICIYVRLEYNRLFIEAPYHWG